LYPWRPPGLARGDSQEGVEAVSKNPDKVGKKRCKSGELPGKTDSRIRIGEDRDQDKKAARIQESIVFLKSRSLE
jgi:hypothetical protein